MNVRREKARLALAALVLLPACGAHESPSTPATDPPPATTVVTDAGASTDLDATSVADATPPPPPPPARDASVADCGAFAPATNLEANGPFETVREGAGPDCLIVRPKTLGENGVRHPVIIWGNGTDAPTTVYAGAFDYWASHGFVVAAANAVNGQGSGAPQLACLDWVLGENAKAGSAYEGKICPNVAATGHSQGGAGALMVGRDPRVTVTAPLMAYTGQGWGGFQQSSITAQEASPMLLLSGTADDNAVPDTYQKPVYLSTNVPVFWANLIGGNHYTTALGLPTYRSVMLAWFRLHLMNDQSMRPTFYGSTCTLCGDTAHWIVKRRGTF